MLIRNRLFYFEKINNDQTMIVISSHRMLAVDGVLCALCARFIQSNSKSAKLILFMLPLY